MKIDLDTLKTMKELLSNQHMGEIVPVRDESNDSFSVFTGGLRENWPIVLTGVAVAFWLINGSNEQKSINAYQDVQIESNVEDIRQNTVDIEQLNKNVQLLNTTQVSNYNDLVRRMDALQASIEALKKETQ